MAVYYVSMLFLTVLNQVMAFPSRIVKNKQFAITACILLIGIMGLRDPSVGSDTIMYQSRFEQAPALLNDPTLQAEFGFNYLNYFLHATGMGFQAYLFVVLAVYVVITVAFLYRYSINVYQSTMYYLTIGGFTMAMSGIRQTIASAAVMIAMDLTLKKRHMALAILAVLVGYSIHNSAIIFLPFLFMRSVRLRRAEVAIVMAVCTLALFYRNLLYPVVAWLRPPKYADLSYFTNYRMNPLLILICILIPLFCLLMIPVKDPLTRRYDALTSNLFIYSCFNIFFTILSLNNNQVGRLAYYFSISNLILIPMALAAIEDKKLRLVYGAAIMALSVLMFFISTPGGTLHIDQYRFFWQQA